MRLPVRTIGARHNEIMQIKHSKRMPLYFSQTRIHGLLVPCLFARGTQRPKLYNGKIHAISTSRLSTHLSSNTVFFHSVWLYGCVNVTTLMSTNIKINRVVNKLRGLNACAWGWNMLCVFCCCCCCCWFANFHGIIKIIKNVPIQ